MKKYFLQAVVIVVFFILITLSTLYQKTNENMSATVAKQPKGTEKEQLVDGIQALNSQLISLNTVYQKSSGTKDRADEGQVLAGLVRQRKTVMLKLMKEDPVLFNALAIEDQVRSQLPASVQKDIEQKVTITGKIEAIQIDDFDNIENSHLDYFIYKKGQKYTFYPSSEIALISGTSVSVTGYVLDDIITANVNTKGLIKLSQPSLDSVGDQKTLVILVKSLPGDSEPFTVDQAKNLVFNGQFQKFMQEQSYGQVSFSGDVVGWFVTGGPDFNCYGGGASSLTPSQLSEVVSTYSVDLSKYGRIIYLANNAPGGCSSVGRGPLTVSGIEYTVSQSSIGVSDSYNAPSGWGNQPFEWTNLDFVLSHELGHALGLLHANGWDCVEETLYSDCYHLEYGNYFDTMGGVSLSLDFNVFFKELLGWIPASRILSISQSGIYSIGSLEEADGVAGAKINVRTSSGTVTPYYLEHRRAIGFDSNLDNPTLLKNSGGLFINAINTDAYPMTRLLDLHSTSEDWYNDLSEQATLNSGEVFKDENQGVTIDSVNQTGTSTLSFNVVLDEISCKFNKPSLNLSSYNYDGVSVSGSGSIMVDIQNNDSVVCDPSAFHISVTLPRGWTSYVSDDLIISPNKGARDYIDYYPMNAMPGTYTLAVEVTNLQGELKDRKTIDVTITPSLSISSLIPASGSAGTPVIISGTGFSEYKNWISFTSPSGWFNIQDVNSSKGGTEISFNIPATVETCDDEGNDCHKIPTPDGEYWLGVSARGASDNARFTVGPVAVPSVIVITGTPMLELLYDTTRKESQLKSTFNFSVTGGSQDAYVYQYGADAIFTDQNGNNYWTSAQVQPLSATSSAQTTTDANGATLYVVPANQAVNFKVVSSKNPKQMFAGSYSASLKSISLNYAPNSVDQGGQIIEVPDNKSNSKTIIGELSPYITSVVATPVPSTSRVRSGVGKVNIKIVGARLTNGLIYVDNVRVTPTIIGLTPTEINISLVTLTAGQHALKIVNRTSGESNAVSFTVGP